MNREWYAFRHSDGGFEYRYLTAVEASEYGNQWESVVEAATGSAKVMLDMKLKDGVDRAVMMGSRFVFIEAKEVDFYTAVRKIF